jgi:hypothetical protein
VQVERPHAHHQSSIVRVRWWWRRGETIGLSSLRDAEPLYVETPAVIEGSYSSRVISARAIARMRFRSLGDRPSPRSGGYCVSDLAATLIAISSRCCA